MKIPWGCMVALCYKTKQFFCSYIVIISDWEVIECISSQDLKNEWW